MGLQPEAGVVPTACPATAMFYGAAPVPVEAVEDPIITCACQASDGTRTVTICYDTACSTAHIVSWLDHTMSGPCECNGNISGPEAHVRTGLPSGPKGVTDIDVFDTYFHKEELVTVGLKDPRWWEEAGSATPLFDMWLLTGGGRERVLVGESRPLVNRQKPLCAPGEEWVAEQVLCHRILYDKDFWEWAVHGKARLHVDDSIEYCRRYEAVIEKEEPEPTSPDPAI
jgi:hypothetical protein